MSDPSNKKQKTTNQNNAKLDLILAKIKEEPFFQERFQEDESAWTRLCQDVLEQDTVKLVLSLTTQEKHLCKVISDQMKSTIKLQEQERELQDAKKTLQSITIFGLLQLKDSEIFTLYSKGTSSSCTSTGHEDANSVLSEFHLNALPTDGNDQWTGLSSIWEKKSSSLLSVDTRDKSLVYANEADLQTYVHMAVLDAIFICNELIAKAAGDERPVQKLSHRREASLLSYNKPDHTVIYESMSGIDILTIEDKKPQDEMENELEVLGQVYDCLIALAAFGHPNPFGILTTFEETWVAWTHPESAGIAASNERFNFKDLALLAQTLPARDGTPLRKNTPPSSKSSSPPFLMSESKLVVTKQRKVYLSKQAYQAHELVPLLCNAIFCGLQNITGHRKPRSWEPGNPFNGPFLRFTTKTYEWVEGGLPFNRKAATEQGSLANMFIAFELLGVGETSRAFRAVTEDGHECVIKMYIRKFENNVPLTKAEFNVKARESVEREVERYKKIYDDLNAYVWWTILNRFYCVILPYFKPVAVKDRRGLLGDVRSLLTQTFKPKHFRFADSDIRWRHVGTFDEKVYLFDLADLEQCATVDTFDAYIDEHLAVLTTKCENPGPPHVLDNSPTSD